MAKPHLIGLSLPICIIQIADGTIARSDVKEIIAACTREAFLNRVIPEYPKGYWSRSPKKSVKIAQEMYDKGLIKFPKDENESHFPITPNLVHWVESYDDIVWFDGN